MERGGEETEEGRSFDPYCPPPPCPFLTITLPAAPSSPSPALSCFTHCAQVEFDLALDLAPFMSRSEATGKAPTLGTQVWEGVGSVTSESEHQRLSQTSSNPPQTRTLS